MQYPFLHPRAIPWLALVTLIVVLAAVPARGQAPAAAVDVRADVPLGPWDAGRFTNLTYAAGYGTTTSPEAEHAFRWMRTTGAVDTIRCATWLGDGIAADAPEAMAGASVYSLDASGQPMYHWERLDRALDVILSAGARPLIVCGGVPDALAEGQPRYGVLGAAVNRPRDYGRYRALLRDMVRHLEKTYGASEVRRWSFEVWSGPDHAAFWEDGRRPPFTSPTTEAQMASFLRLYDHFAAGLAEADRRLRLGGPGLWGDPSFLRRFLAHCARSTNSVTGKIGARLDFISWQARGTAAEIAASVASLRGELARSYPELKHAELVVSSWSGPVDEPALRPERDAAALGPEAAARIVALADLCLRPYGQARVRPSRPDPDVSGPRLFRGSTLVADHFQGSRPVFARLGASTVPLPAFRAMQWLRQLGPERVKVNAEGEVGALAARTRAGGVQVLVYRLDERPDTPEIPKAFGTIPARVRVRGLPSRLVGIPLRLFLLDSEHGNIYGEWVAAGRPDPAPEALAEPYAGRAELAPLREDPAYPVRRGEMEVTIDLQPNSVALLRLGSPLRERRCEPKGRIRRVLQAERAYYDAWEVYRTGQYEQAAQGYRDLAERYRDCFWSELALASLAAVYDRDLHQPAAAEQVWQELLARPIDDVERLRILRELLLQAVRRQDAVATQALRGEIDALEAALERKRVWEAPPLGCP